jgi:hypothetical protein
MNKIILFLIVILSAYNYSYSQSNNIAPADRYNLKKSPSVSDEYQIKILVQSVVNYYKESFKYYHEFKDGFYSIETSNSGLNVIPPLFHRDDYSSHVNQIARHQNDKYEIIISLPKYSYVKYEPININIQVINHDSKQLELMEGFMPEEKGCNVTIIDKYGQTTGGNKIRGELTFAYTSPSYIIQPGDTLFTSMAINDWGLTDIAVNNYDNLYFHYGYFDSGKYTAYLSRWFDLIPDKMQGFYLSSNKVEFEVTELNHEDIEVLRLLKLKKPDDSRYLKEVVDMYPNNTFAEHLFAYYLKGHSRIMAYKEYDWKDSLEIDYKNFIKEYPNSSYLLNDLFVAPYIYNHFIKINNLKDSFESEIEDFKSLNKNNALRYLLKDNQRSKRILRIE